MGSCCYLVMNMAVFFGRRPEVAWHRQELNIFEVVNRQILGLFTATREAWYVFLFGGTVTIFGGTKLLSVQMGSGHNRLSLLH